MALGFFTVATVDVVRLPDFLDFMELSEAVLQANEAVILNLLVLCGCVVNDLIDLIVIVIFNE